VPGLSGPLREVLEQGLEVLQGNRRLCALLAQHLDVIAFEDEEAVPGGKRWARGEVFRHGDGSGQQGGQSLLEPFGPMGLNEGVMGGEVEEEGEEVDESDQSLFALSADNTKLVAFQEKQSAGRSFK
jgi:hypothetical protein